MALQTPPARSLLLAPGSPWRKRYCVNRPHRTAADVYAEVRGKAMRCHPTSFQRFCSACWRPLEQGRLWAFGTARRAPGNSSTASCRSTRDELPALRKVEAPLCVRRADSVWAKCIISKTSVASELPRPDRDIGNTPRRDSFVGEPDIPPYSPSILPPHQPLRQLTEPRRRPGWAPKLSRAGMVACGAKCPCHGSRRALRALREGGKASSARRTVTGSMKR